ncbi:DUF222 domain-containing protein [Georgenia sp. AZ-5]|uniref:HNH endonuclease signature motif containing protein n=1 Tax=Georgenia sp. AZ-5 TaxID=3367526 RepID=UPI00375511E3
METPAGALEAGLAQARAIMAELNTVDLHGVPGPTVVAALDEVERLRRQAEALAARALAVIEADGSWALDGARSLAAWYRARSGKHHAAAAREIRQARALRDHLPATARALAAGRISVDHVHAMVRHTTDTDTRKNLLRDPEVGEALLLEHAVQLDASDFSVAVQQWGLQADPDASDRRYREDIAREEFFLSETTDGYVPGGWLSKTSGKLVLTALSARTGTPSRTDRRTPGQRRANALVGIAQLALDSGTLRPGARIRPHLTVTVPFETLQRLAAASAPKHRPGCRLANHPGAALGVPQDLTGTDRSSRRSLLGGGVPPPSPASSVPATGPRDAGGGTDAPATHERCTCGIDGAELIEAAVDPAAMATAEPATFEDGTPLSPALLGRLACSSGLHRVVFGPDSEVLDLGREERLFSAAQTRAIIARDKRCQYPHCNAPPGEGEIHHSVWWWAQCGSTNTKLGTLLCWYHHDYVHAHGIAIERRRRRWVFIRRDGTLIGAEPPQPDGRPPAHGQTSRPDRRPPAHGQTSRPDRRPPAHGQTCAA